MLIKSLMIIERIEKDLYIKNGKLNLMFNTPSLATQEGVVLNQIPIDWINITVEKNGIFKKMYLENFLLPLDCILLKGKVKIQAECLLVRVDLKERINVSIM